MYKIELSKILGKKSTKILMIIYAVMLAGLLGIYTYGEAGLNLSIYNSGQFVLSSLKTMMALILPFIVLYLSSSTFVSEFKNNTIKNLFLLPVKKYEIYAAKLLSVQTIIAALLGIQLIISMIFGTFIDGFAFSMSTLTSYFGAFIILGLINVLSSLLSMFLNTTGMVVIVSYIGFIALNVLGYMVPQLQIISISHMMGQYQMIFSSFTLLLSVVAYYILLTIIGYQLFEKKEAMICQSE